ncbi:MAG TPA: glycosyltransferase family 4 protein [Drouetiella sp.]
MQNHRIVLCPSAYYPSLGGVEEICRNLAKTLAASGNQVVIAVNRHPEDLPASEHLHGVDVRRFPFKYPNRSVSGLRELLAMPINIANFLLFVQSYQPDIIHVICPSSNSLYCYVAKILFGKKLLVTLQGEFFMDAGDIYGKSAFARFGAQKLLEVADGVTACSNYVLTDAKNRFAFESPVEKVVFNGVDLNEKSVPIPLVLPKKFVFGVGRLVENKGFDDLIAAYDKLRAVVPDVDLVIAGAGPYADKLKELCVDRNLNDRVHFVGRQDRASVSDLFSKCLFFVLPSHFEPFGIVCLESMRAGKAVIASDIGGPPEFIKNNETGLLFEPRSIESLFEKMLALCSDDKLRETLGKNAKAMSKNFGWTEISKSYEALYEQI